MEFLLHLTLIIAFSCCISSSGGASYRKELRTKNLIDKNTIEHSDRSTQQTRVDPSQVIQLSWRPRVFLYRGFLSDEECNHLISLAQGKLETSLVNDLDSTMIDNSNQLPTSVGIEQDDVVARIENRISAWTFLPKGNSEPLKIMHYVREDTRERLDYYDDKTRPGFGEPLMATVVLYLSNVTQGGETLFLKSEERTRPNSGSWSECAKAGYAVKPIKGNALVFFNAQPNASPDESSSNARCPVLQGEKWCATKIFHLRAIQNKRASVESESEEECTDEEDLCRQWADKGECEKNPVYMKGTPDYSGSCRKSCNAC